MDYFYTISGGKHCGLTIRQLLWGGVLSLFFLTPGYSQPNIPGLKAWAIATGQTTGHIGDLHLHNTTGELIRFSWGPLLIPAANNTQGYALPDKLSLLIKPGGYHTLPLRGFCTNPFLPPVEAGLTMPAVELWIESDEAPLWRPNMPLPADQGFRPIRGRRAMGATFPGAYNFIDYTIDIDSFPRTAARLVIDIVQAVEYTYEFLKAEGRIDTPYRDNARRQEDAVEQQAIWYALGLLEGNGYDIEVFRGSLAKQFDAGAPTPLNQASKMVQDDFEKGVQEFWAAFLQLGYQARVIRSGG